MKTWHVLRPHSGEFVTSRYWEVIDGALWFYNNDALSRDPSEYKTVKLFASGQWETVTERKA